jgi:4-amino-4-deoxy-L-arabinose transferase-like glycosyltransferase
MSTIEGRIEGDLPPSWRSALGSSLPWRVWRSPPGQPTWARPALLAVAGVACLSYAWGAGNVELEPYYGAAARSMSESWHAFFFGAFDPAGTVTVDKLPGGLWPQALSLGLFGFHTWAMVLPQILAGVLTVLVLYRAVRRLAGPVAGIVAAVAIAASPVTVAMNRGNVADSLLILLTVLAADATSAALLTGRVRSLLLAGLWVGLAFQAKMVQAWLILPALALAYGLAAPDRPRNRARNLALAGLVTVLVSLSWMTVVSLVPAGERPYVDGTRNDSVFTQVFSYNGTARLGLRGVLGNVPQHAPFVVKLNEESEGATEAEAIKPSWHRLLGGLLGRDDGWLLPAALIGAVGALLERRGAGRRDPLRACVLLWGTWLLVLFVVFSGADYVNSYYVAALSPATAALCGVGAAVFWRQRQRAVARACLAAAVLACTGYGAYLLQGGTAVPGWLLPVALCIGVGGALAAVVVHPLRSAGRWAGFLASLVLACALVVPAVTSALMVTRNLGPFTAPYQAASSTGAPGASVQQQLSGARQVVDHFSSTYHTPIPFAIGSSLLAGPYIFATGREILSIGGYWGGAPVPTLAQLQRYVASKEVRAFLVPIKPLSADPRVVWVRTHCMQLGRVALSSEVQLAVYDCAAR